MSWTPKAETRISFHYCPNPPLDPERPFVVEVEWQCFSSSKSQTYSFHVPFFFFKKLTPAEQNYDISNREHWAGGSSTSIHRPH